MSGIQGIPAHAWIGKSDPVQNNSQNPVGYVDLPEEAQFRERPCGCGCGAISIRDFLPGHDVCAMQERVRRLFAGSALEIIAWVDRMAAEHGLPIPEIRNPAALAADRRPLPSLVRYDALLRYTSPAAATPEPVTDQA
ncbi:hypothetical protein AB0E01_44425 [Nocardia vinacea]|uniref:hypothetical protein n=1 Tax=Nocardia vinacea TaxID=96468 RepID=UPI0033FF18CD